MPPKTLITAYPYEFDSLMEAFRMVAAWHNAPLLYDIDGENERQISLVLRYFVGDKAVEKQGVFLHKGLLLCGNVGTGKSSIMEIMRQLAADFFPANHFQSVTARELVLAYESQGSRGIEKYIWNTSQEGYGNKKPVALCMEDIGIGNENARYFSNSINVVAEILLGRYVIYKSLPHRRITHLTTNLNADKIEELYGNRVRSRFREMFNLILFEGKDRRK